MHYQKADSITLLNDHAYNHRSLIAEKTLCDRKLPYRGFYNKQNSRQRISPMAAELIVMIQFLPEYSEEYSGYVLLCSR